MDHIIRGAVDQLQIIGSECIGKAIVNKFEGEIALISDLPQGFHEGFPVDIAREGIAVEVGIVIIIVNVGANDIFAKFLHGVEHGVFAK